VPADKRGQSGAHGREQLARDEDPVKAESARIFYEAWRQAADNQLYQRLKREHVARYER
jgi:hypothetical protein